MAIALVKPARPKAHLGEPFACKSETYNNNKIKQAVWHGITHYRKERRCDPNNVKTNKAN